jgi:hypothetical protein
MDDKELLEFVEQRMFYVMLEGCLMNDHLGVSYDVGVWTVGFRSDTIARLLDMAKEKKL